MKAEKKIKNEHREMNKKSKNKSPKSENKKKQKSHLSIKEIINMSLN